MTVRGDRRSTIAGLEVVQGPTAGGEGPWTSLSTLVQVVASQGGLTLLPELALEVENRNANLATLRLQHAPSRTLGLIWRGSSPLGDLLRELAAVVAAALPGPSQEGAPSPRRRKVRAKTR